MTAYHKLVRDRVPEIIKSAGKIASYRQLDDEEFRAALKAKVVEEAGEFFEASGDALLLELADVFEVLDAVLRAFNLSHTDLAAARDKRNAERGTFTRQVFLESVAD